MLEIITLTLTLWQLLHIARRQADIFARNERINHFVEAFLWVCEVALVVAGTTYICLVAYLILGIKMPINPIPLFFSLFGIRWIFFDIFINLIRGRDVYYVGTEAYASLFDKFSRWLNNIRPGLAIIVKVSIASLVTIASYATL